MTYTAVLSGDFGSYAPTLANVRISVDGQTISSGITAVSNAEGTAFEATVTTLADGFRGPFTFYDNIDATKYAVGAVGPEHEHVNTDLSTLATSASISALNDLSAAEVNAEVDTALGDYDGPTKAEMDSAFATTDGLIGTVDGVVDAILVDTGTTIPASVSALPDTAAINAEVDTALADYDAPTKAELDAAVAPLSTFDHTSDEVITDAASRTASQATGFSTHSATDVRTEMDANSTQLAAIVADTNELQTDDVPGLIAALNNLSTADVDARLSAYDAPTKAEMDSAFSTTDGLITTLDGIVDAILVDTDVTIPALIAALNDLSAAEVNAEVDTAISDAALATAASVAAIPTNPLLTTDTRLNNLDATVSSRSTFDHTADDVTTDAASRTASQADVSSLATSASITALNDISTAEVASELTTYDAATGTEVAAISSAVAALNDLSTSDIDARLAAAEPLNANITEVTGTAVGSVNDFKANAVTIDTDAIADAVWDEPTVGHTTAGTFGVLFAAVATAASVAEAVWQYATRTLTSSPVQTSNAASGAALTITRGVTFTHTFSGTIPSNWERMIFTAKDDDCCADAQSIAQVVVTNPAAGSDGMLYLERSEATASQGAIVVDQPNGTAALTIHDHATAQMFSRAVADGADYDVKLLLGDSTSSLFASGTISVEHTPTWAT